MAKAKKSSGAASTADYRYPDKRKNVPPAAMAAEGNVPQVAKVRYQYSPHLPPVLRFDPTGKEDALPPLVEEAGKRPLTADEQRLLAEALRRHEPWLEWAGKRESDSERNGRGYLDVDPVALHIHERVSAQAVLRVAARQDAARDLFADPEQEYRDAVQFYQHDIDWANRLILGDSLQVMSSLARREGLAGKVQMIYIDPPYEINFRSNFQSLIAERSVSDADEDLTREVETVRAYRDTWRLGVHSYLSYLRERLLAARELLADTGSLFVQINEKHCHRVRNLLDEVFGVGSFVRAIGFRKTVGQTTTQLPPTFDYLLWYARDRSRLKYHVVSVPRDPVTDERNYTYFQLPDGRLLKGSLGTYLSDEERLSATRVRTDNLTSQTGSDSSRFPFSHAGRVFVPSTTRGWSTSPVGLERLDRAERLVGLTSILCYRRLASDSQRSQLSNYWDDVGIGTASGKLYVVQTAAEVIQRCMMMTTDPGDLVFDPTCGSGTTAYVAEMWGRRWITTDTSRVALAVARQRLLTATYEHYKLRNPALGPSGGLVYGTAPEISLGGIAQNTNLDPIFAKSEPVLEERLRASNESLELVTDAVRTRLLTKLLEKQKAEGKKAVMDADRRRWALPKAGGRWEHWEVPFDTDPDWPKGLQDAVTGYRRDWRAKMDEVNACIAANADQEELVDQPEVVKGVVRVSGPFTVEAVQPPEVSLAQAGFPGAPEALETGFIHEALPEYGADEAKNTLAYLRQMFGLLRKDGVRFLGNREMLFSRLDPLFESGRVDMFHAEGRWVVKGETDKDPEGAATVGVVFGPQYGPVTALMLEEIIRPAARRYEDLVVAGFNFDGPAQQVIQSASHPKLRIHMAHIRPDVNPGMAGLLKEQPGSQLFTVFGQPRVSAKKTKSGEWTVAMEGVDIYDPVANTVVASKAEKIAAWFLDGDYDGRTFCITQAFFPDKDAWARLAKALKGVLDEDRFAALSGTVSLPFPAGKYKRAAVKAIDPRGNEVMATLSLEG